MSLNQRLDDLWKQRDALDRERQSAAASVQEATKRYADMTAFVTKETVSAENPAHRDLETRLYNEMMQRLDQLRTYNPTAVPVKQIDASISQVEAWLSQQKATTTQSETKEANPLRAQLARNIQDTQLHLVETTSALQTLDDQIRDVTAERDGVITAGIQYDQLSRDVETAKTSYLDNLHDLESARKDRMLDLSRISNVAVAQQPTLNLARTFPATLQFLALSPVLAALFTAVVLYILAITDRRIRDDMNFARQLGLPLLAVIPEFARGTAPGQRVTAEAMSALHYLQPRLPRPNGDGETVTIGFVGLDADDGLPDLVSALQRLYGAPPRNVAEPPATAQEVELGQRGPHRIAAARKRAQPRDAESGGCGGFRGRVGPRHDSARPARDRGPALDLRRTPARHRRQPQAHGDPERRLSSSAIEAS